MIDALLFQEFIVAAHFHDMAVVDNHNDVTVAYGGQAVGNHNHGTALGDGFDVFHDDVLRFIVERTGRFIEDDDARVSDKGAGNGHTLALTAGEQTAAFTDECIVAMGHLVDEFAGTCQRCCPHHIFMGCIGAGNADVFLDGAAKEHAVLQHYANLTAQPCRFDLRDVYAINQDAAGFWYVETLNEFGQGALTGAGTPHDADFLASRNGEVYLVEHAVAFFRIAEAHAVDFDTALDARQGRASGIEGRFCFFVHNIAQSFHGYTGLLEILPHADQAHNRCDNLPCQHLEGDEVTDGNGGPHNVDGTNPENGEVEAVLQEHGNGAGHIGQIDNPQHAVDVAGQHILVTANEVAFDTRSLDGADTRDGFNQEGAVFTANQEAVINQTLVDWCHHDIQQHKERNHQQHNHAKHRAEDEHDNQVDGGKDDIEHDSQGRTCEEGTEIFQFPHTGNHVTDLPFGEVFHRQGRDIAEQAAR